MENTNPRIFTNVRVFAGDKVKPAADASYRNLLWENFHVDHSFNIGAKIQDNKQIGTIDSWGPFFRVSVDLIIHSLDQDSQWSSVFSILHGSGTENKIEVPSIYLGSDGVFLFKNNVRNEKHWFKWYNVELNHWYNIVIEQKSIIRKVLKC